MCKHHQIDFHLAHNVQTSTMIPGAWLVPQIHNVSLFQVVQICVTAIYHALKDVRTLMEKSMCKHVVHLGKGWMTG